MKCDPTGQMIAKMGEYFEFLVHRRNDGGKHPFGRESDWEVKTLY